MARVMITCPVTGKPAPTGFNMDASSFASTTMQGNSMTCSQCGQKHKWGSDEAYLEQDRGRNGHNGHHGKTAD